MSHATRRVRPDAASDLAGDLSSGKAASDRRVDNAIYPALRKLLAVVPPQHQVDVPLGSRYRTSPQHVAFGGRQAGFSKQRLDPIERRLPRGLCGVGPARLDCVANIREQEPERAT